MDLILNFNSENVIFRFTFLRFSCYSGLTNWIWWKISNRESNYAQLCILNLFLNFWVMNWTPTWNSCLRKYISVVLLLLIALQWLNEFSNGTHEKVWLIKNWMLCKFVVNIFFYFLNFLHKTDANSRPYLLTRPLYKCEREKINR